MRTIAEELQDPKTTRERRDILEEARHQLSHVMLFCAANGVGACTASVASGSISWCPTETEKTDTIKCPICNVRLPKGDSGSQGAHMNWYHSDHVSEQLRAAGRS